MPHVSQSFQTWKTTYPCVHKFYKLEENDSCVPNLALPLPTWPDITFTNSWIGIKTYVCGIKALQKSQKSWQKKIYSTTGLSATKCMWDTMQLSLAKNFFFPHAQPMFFLACCTCGKCHWCKIGSNSTIFRYSTFIYCTRPHGFSYEKGLSLEKYWRKLWTQ